MSAASIPAFPEVDASLLEEHRRLRCEATEQIDALSQEPADLFRFHGGRRIVESLANLFLDDRVMLLPPRRRHLHESLERRLGGTAAAFRHIDSRLAMIRLGHLDQLVGHETPHVLNAFAESHEPNDKETNAGLIRLTPSGFDTTQSSFQPPDGAECAELLDACVDAVNHVNAPAIVRAAWFAAAFLAIHPFVDGNGRTARLMFQLISSSDSAERLDWGTVEMFAIARTAYVDALKASQAPSLPEYDGGLIDVAPFVDHAIRCSIEGATLVQRRVLWFERAWESLEADPAPLRAIDIAVVSSGGLALDELGELVDAPEATEVAEALVSAGRLVWDRRGLLRPRADNALLALPG